MSATGRGRACALAVVLCGAILAALAVQPAAGEARFWHGSRAQAPMLTAAIVRAFDGRPPLFEIRRPAQHPLGVALVIHGGGWQGVGMPKIVEMRPVARRLRQWGWLTVNIDYARGGGSLADVLRFHAAIRAAIGPRIPLIVDGQSAGGTLALLLAEQAPDVSAVVAAAAPTELSSLTRDHAKPWLQTRIARLLGGRAGLARWSPALGVTRLRAPLLLAYARTDTIVPLVQGRLMHALAPRSQLVVLDPGWRGWIHSRVSESDFRALQQTTRSFLADAAYRIYRTQSGW